MSLDDAILVCAILAAAVAAGLLAVLTTAAFAFLFDSRLWISSIKVAIAASMLLVDLVVIVLVLNASK